MEKMDYHQKYNRNIKGVPSVESSRSVRGLGKDVSGKPYPRLCNARRPRLKPETFRSQAVTLPLAKERKKILCYLAGLFQNCHGVMFSL